MKYFLNSKDLSVLKNKKKVQDLYEYLFEVFYINDEINGLEDNFYLETNGEIIWLKSKIEFFKQVKQEHFTFNPDSDYSEITTGIVCNSDEFTPVLNHLVSNYNAVYADKHTLEF